MRLNELIFEIVKNKKIKIGIYMPITLAVILLQINKKANNGVTLDNFKGLIFNQQKTKESTLKKVLPYQEDNVTNNQNNSTRNLSVKNSNLMNMTKKHVGLNHSKSSHDRRTKENTPKPETKQALATPSIISAAF